MRKALLLLVALTASCGGPAAKSPSAAATAPKIAWARWGANAFARARSEHKLLLVDVGIEGCTACRWMHEGTYRDAEVARRVQEDFVPVSVDADQQPDIGARYEPWGWPAEIFLTGDGAVALAIQGSEPAKDFVPVLDDLAKRYAAGTLSLRGHVVHGAPESSDAALDARCAAVVSTLDAGVATRGWGGGFHVVEAPPVDLDFYRAAARGDDGKSAHGVSVAVGESKVIDPVWGGVFVAARTDLWEHPIPEKRMLHQAAALTNFAEALDASHDDAWRKRIADVDRYVRGWMTSPDGTFYSTQKDEPPHLPPGMNATTYYALDDAHRRALGIPPIDHGIYTDQNGRVVAAYVRAWEATGEARYLASARRATDALLAKRSSPDGWVVQVTATPGLQSDARYRPTAADGRLYLAPQGELGLALVALYEATGEARYRDAALRIGEATRATLEAPSGGFFATAKRDTDDLVPPDKPMEANVQTARFFLRLGRLTHDDAWRASARRALAQVSERDVKTAGWADKALFAQALYELLGGFVEISLVGPDGAAKTALWTAAARLAAPRKLVHAAVPGSYPDHGKAVAYACTLTECSSPIADPSGLAGAVGKLEKMGARICGGE